MQGIISKITDKIIEYPQNSLKYEKLLIPEIFLIILEKDI